MYCCCHFLHIKEKKKGEGLVYSKTLPETENEYELCCKYVNTVPVVVDMR